ncbi:MAG: hypothetical protein NTW68_12745 [candidate division NC10 bacterium]|nr:hypothetical protein [candidate division NC10 bacterium]
MAEAEQFPERAEYLAARDLIVQKLGWQCEVWGGYLLVAGGWCLAQKEDVFQLVGLAALLAGLGLLGWVTRRRVTRTALCVRGDRVGIYRRGRLDMEVAREDIVLLRTSILNTVKFALAPCMGVFLGLIPVVDAFRAPAGGLALLDVAAGVALSVSAGVSLVFLIYTRHVWRVLQLPCKSRVWAAEDFRVSRQEASRLGYE